MHKITIFFLFVIILVLGGCSNNDSNASTTSTEIDAEVIKISAIKINNLTLKVHENTFNTTTKMYNDINRTLIAFDRMSESILNTMDNGLKLINAYAQPFTIADSYSGIFTLNADYTATSPVFAMNISASGKYFLLSSETQLYNEKKTIKTYFTDGSSLTNAWVRSISMANQSKDLFLSLIEISTDGTSKKITNSFLIKSADLQAL